MTQDTPPKLTIDTRNAGIYVGYTPVTLRQWRRLGRGPAFVRAGRSIRYLVADLDRWLDEHRVDPARSSRVV